MKRIWAAMILTTALSAPGLAADLGARTYAKAPVVAPVSNWSGFYVGGNLGYGWGDGNTDFSFLPTPAEVGLNNTRLGAHSTDITGGVQLGYNWQIGALVTGLEADIQGSDIKKLSSRDTYLCGHRESDSKRCPFVRAKAFMVRHGARPSRRHRHPRAVTLWHRRSGIWPC